MTTESRHSIHKVNFEDTIFAIASGSGQAAIAVMRLSGPTTASTLAALIRGNLPPLRRASVRKLIGRDGAVLDHAMVLWLPGPGSYTGEDSAELHLHAGPAVLEGVAAALVELGLRPGEPGEFTRRAFMNGRMALTQAEAVADLIAAETQAQRQQALRQLDGVLGRLFDGWAHRLRHLLSEQEALIDFPDETEDVVERESEISGLIAEIKAQLDDDHRGERLRSGLRIAVSGAPNVGKSSLVNALAKRDAAIVSATPGTTRDVVEVSCTFGGVPALLLDTAGLRDSDDPVEREGIRRARASAAAADLVLQVMEAGTWAAGDAGGPCLPADKNTVLIASKIDLAPPPADMLGISVTTGEGMDRLRTTLNAHAKRLTHHSGPPPLTQARHRAACREAVGHLRAAVRAPAAELRAEDLRLAMQALGRVTGRVDVEDVLDSVFSQFCIGK